MELNGIGFEKLAVGLSLLPRQGFIAKLLPPKTGVDDEGEAELESLQPRWLELEDKFSSGVVTPERISHNQGQLNDEEEEEDAEPIEVWRVLLEDNLSVKGK